MRKLQRRKYGCNVRLTRMAKSPFIPGKHRLAACQYLTQTKQQLPEVICDFRKERYLSGYVLIVGVFPVLDTGRHQLSHSNTSSRESFESFKVTGGFHGYVRHQNILPHITTYICAKLCQDTIPLITCCRLLP